MKRIKNIEKIWLPLLLVILCLVPTFQLGRYFNRVFALIGVYAILALSLNLITGYMGQTSMGHAGLFRSFWHAFSGECSDWGFGRRSSGIPVGTLHYEAVGILFCNYNHGICRSSKDDCPELGFRYQRTTGN